MRDAGQPFDFDNSYARLPAHFYSLQAPTPVAKPSLIRINKPLAELLRVDADWLASDDGVATIAGNQLPTGSQPLAMAYSGHQFGGWNPQLGDGRAVLLGEVIGQDGRRYDVQLKGSGRTKWSRGGDGRSPLGPVMREYIVSEAMTALGVPSSRSLAAVSTGEQVFRDEALPGAVLCRVAQSHIRIGTFQYFAARRDTEALQKLSQHVIQRHYPQAIDSEIPALDLLEAVIDKQASLVSQWQLLGFIHGVMNTDNMLLSGETIDYGPCAFMDAFSADKVFSSIDHGGRYAYQNQPGIAHWNLMQLAQCLLPLIHQAQGAPSQANGEDDMQAAIAAAQAVLDKFPAIYSEHYRQGLNRKLGFAETRDGDPDLIDQLFELMTHEQLDFTLTFRRLSELAGNTDYPFDNSVAELIEFSPAVHTWIKVWTERLAAEPNFDVQRQTSMLNANPALIARNHIVEQCIEQASRDGDFKLFHEFVDVLAKPFDFDLSRTRFATPPTPAQQVRQTFCGT